MLKIMGLFKKISFCLMEISPFSTSLRYMLPVEMTERVFEEG